MKRVLKYSFNCAILVYFVTFIYVSYAMIVSVASEEILMKVINAQVEELSLIAIYFIITVTIANYIFQTKIEKRKNGDEYLWLSLIHFILITLAIAYSSYDFYRAYKLHPEYF
ncbi:hypothetical protein [Flavobacterium tegetincola]|uniref:hypothetical protein n=1 Tax=Flavobacterium tegetincola TaxID=150172 RepID=UPI0003FF37DF|nr:hypothetical protein [Flavobacterium tegetincola]